MNRIRLLAALALAALALSGCAAVQERDVYAVTVITGDRLALSENEILRGIVVMLGEELVIPAGSRVEGSVYILNGATRLGGEVTGGVSLASGTLVLEPGAAVRGDVDWIGGELERAPEAAIDGRLNTPTAIQIPSTATWNRDSLIEQVIWLVVQAGGLGVLAYLLMRWLPGPLERVANAAGQHPVICLSLGLLVFVIGLVVLVIMVFTLVLIPVALLSGLAGFLLALYGGAALGVLIGRWLQSRLGWPPGRAAAAGVGAVIYLMLVNLLGILPYIGALFYFGSLAVGLGAVFVTRLGTRRFVPALDLSPEDSKLAAEFEFREPPESEPD